MTLCDQINLFAQIFVVEKGTQTEFILNRTPSVMVHVSGSVSMPVLSKTLIQPLWIMVSSYS